ncbi:MAG: hypothetical protein AAGI38_19975 [Bacteroidota bacterium]
MKINGNELPKRIFKLIQEDKWIRPADTSKLLRLIVEKSPFEDDQSLLTKMVKGFTLYGLESMKRESISFKKWAESGESVMLHGKKDTLVKPGEVDPDKLILFADFGLGEDTPFGLDFQEDESAPTVVLLYYGKDPFKDNRWVELTKSFEEFEELVMT